MDKDRMRKNRAILRASTIAFFAFAACLTALAQGRFQAVSSDDLGSRTNLPTLTQVAQIRRLSLAQADRHYPVKLRGVVLDYSSLPTLFIADQTGGIYVKATTNQTFLQGQLVELDGVSDGGRFAPMVVPSSLKVVGLGDLPPPRDVSFQRIATGADDSQWVRLTGIVRSTNVQTLKGLLTLPVLATPDTGWWTVECAGQRRPCWPR